jgi:hypothetical protein
MEVYEYAKEYASYSFQYLVITDTQVVKMSNSQGRGIMLSGVSPAYFTRPGTSVGLIPIGGPLAEQLKDIAENFLIERFLSI